MSKTLKSIFKFVRLFICFNILYLKFYNLIANAKIIHQQCLNLLEIIIEYTSIHTIYIFMLFENLKSLKVMSNIGKDPNNNSSIRSEQNALPYFYVIMLE